MSVFKRKTTAGQTADYHYRFMAGGKRYSGVCINCHDLDSARVHEKNVREKIGELEKQKTVKALVENFRDELSCGEKILLSDAYSIAERKPKRKKQSEKHRKSKESRFLDFVAYCEKNFPAIKYINDVKPSHAEDYIAYIRQNGKFTGDKQESLSAATMNRYLEQIKSVFQLLLKQAGMLENPFDGIFPVSEDSETREAFTQKELELILSEAPAFIRDIFFVGFFTALREGDIATLRWSDVLWEHGVIRRKLLKTGAVVEIPIMPPLLEFLKSRQSFDAEYILPEQAKMYLDNPSGISYRVKQFLENELHITTTKKVPGRSRAVSIKDVHSLRHTFCYFAGVAGIPLVVVQSIVGHMTKEMTEHYTSHADRATKREKLAALPMFKALTVQTRRKELTEQTRQQIIKAIQTADDDMLNRIALIVLPVKPKKSLPHSTVPEKSIE